MGVIRNQRRCEDDAKRLHVHFDEEARVTERDVRRIPVSCAASSGEPTGAVAAEHTRERPRSAVGAGGAPAGEGGTVHHSAGPETETSLVSS